MNTDFRLKREMAGRVRESGAARPYENPGYTAAASRLDQLIGKFDALAQHEITGHRAVAGAIAGLRELRGTISERLALLTGVVRAAARELPELSPGISRPDASSSNHSFLTRARVAAQTAATHADLLQKYGMPTTLPEDVNRSLDQFEAVLNDRHAAQAAHVGAHAELEAVTAEIMAVVNQLDAINRFRFRDDPEALAAWRSARNLVRRGSERVHPADAGTDKSAA
jgi:hypothetical protein